MATEETANVTLRFPTRDLERLREIAQAQASTPNRLIVAALRERLADYKPNEAWCSPRSVKRENSGANDRASSAQRALAASIPCSECHATEGVPCDGIAGGFHARRLAAAGVPAEPVSKHTATTSAPTRSYLEPQRWRLESESEVDALTLRNRRRPRRHYEVKLQPAVDSGVTVSIAPSAMQTIRQLVRESPDVETGGQLFGWSTPTKRHIVHAGGLGPNSEQKAMHLSHDPDYEIALAAEIEGDQIIELGHWHSHPTGSLELSQADMQRAAGLATRLDRANIWVELLSGPVQGFENPPLSAWALCPTHDQPWPYEIRRAEVQSNG